MLEVDLRRLPAVAPGTADAELLALRRQYLARQLNALRARVAMLQGRKFPFDEESRELYDAVAPRNDEATFQAVIDAVAARIGGSGDAGAALRSVPPGVRHPAPTSSTRCSRRRLASAAAAPRRTSPCPPGERFTVAYVKDKPWSAYNWYQGGFASLIQVNTDLPIYIDRAIDLACHEGYPGHHVYNALLEQHLVTRARLGRVLGLPAVLAAVADRRGHRQLRHRGGVHARPSARQFERETLFPLAGLDPTRVDEYYDVLAL